MTGSFVSLAGAILAVAGILVLAYWCSRLLGKNWGKASSGRNFKVLDQLQVGKDSRLMVVRLQSHVYLVGVSAAGIQMLTELEDTFEETAAAPETAGEFSFHELIRQHAAIYQKKKRDIDE